MNLPIILPKMTVGGAILSESTFFSTTAGYHQRDIVRCVAFRLMQHCSTLFLVEVPLCKRLLSETKFGIQQQYFLKEQTTGR